MRKEIKIREFIMNELSKFNFKKGTKGFKYLNEAITICLKDENAIGNLNKCVFPIIAEKYNEKSAKNVKWCIEQIIKTMYSNTSENIICEYFKLEKNVKPTVKGIIYTIVCKYQWIYYN